ncbi:hypothetical protein ACFOLC_15530 [Lysobacter cavernae]|uniref:WD40 repeat domain-containing protein n=1 Tax=Lysobacter cavernae TaxID=1685901 RepID=A0ABV7RSS3_9GAMM
MKAVYISLALLALSGCSNHAGAKYRFIESQENVDSSIFFFSKDALVSDGGCRFFHIDTMTHSKDCDLPDTPRWVTPDPSGNLLFVTSSRNEVSTPNNNATDSFHSYIFDVNGKKVIFSENKALYSSPIAIHPSGKLIATTELSNPDKPETASIKLSDDKKHKVFSTVPAGNVADLRFKGSELIIAEMWDGSQLTLCVRESRLQVCDVAAPDLGTPHFLSSPDGRFIVTPEQQSITVREIRNGGLSLKIPLDTSLETGRFAAFSSDGHRLVIKGNLDNNGTKSYGFVVVQLR